MPKIFKNSRGFTLVELLVVISIIAILSTIGSVVYTNTQKNARDAKRKTDLYELSKAVRQYRLVNSIFPAMGTACSSGSAGQVTNWENLKTQLAPYMQNFPGDPLDGNIGSCGATTPCQYCYTPLMWCYVPPSSTEPGGTSTCNPEGAANFYTRLETCTASQIGDSPRFRYGCTLHSRSIDPL